MSNDRKTKLEQSRRLHTFYQEWEEEDIFFKEKEREAVSKDVGKDLVSLTRLFKKHEVFFSTLLLFKEVWKVLKNFGYIPSSNSYAVFVLSQLPARALPTSRVLS